MLPGAGLFLPETLHRGQKSKETQMEAEGTGPSLFQQQTGRLRHRSGASTSTLSLAHRKSSGNDNSGYPFMSVAFDYADFVSSSRKGPSDSSSLDNLIHRLQKDLAEASRLYVSPAVTGFLEAWPDERSWIDNALHDTRHSLSDIGTYIESSPAISDDGGTKGLRRRFDWVLHHQRRLASKQQILYACHQGLMRAINTMHTAELCGVTNGVWQDQVFEAPVQPWVKPESSHPLRGPHSRRESRLSQKNMTFSSVSLTLTKNNSTDAGSIVSDPVELPGSTPSDLPGSENLDLYGFPRREGTYSFSDSRPSSVDRSHTQSATNTTASERSSIASANSPTMSFRQPGIGDVRKSLEQQISIGAPGSSENPRASLDSARLRAVPDQMQSLPVQNTQLNTPMVHIKSLPTLTETSIERDDSTNSIRPEIQVSKIAKRHQPTSVYIRKSAERHLSLPLVFSPAESQHLLVNDLANWMVPATQSKGSRSAEWENCSNHRSPTFSSPSNSIASCPAAIGPFAYRPYSVDASPKRMTLTESQLAIGLQSHQKHGSVSSERRSDELFFETLKTDTESPKSSQSLQNSEIYHEQAPSILGTTSSPTRKPQHATSISTNPKKSFPTSASDSSLDPSEIPLLSDLLHDNLNNAASISSENTPAESPLTTNTEDNSTPPSPSLTPLSDNTDSSPLHQSSITIAPDSPAPESKRDKITEHESTKTAKEEKENTHDATKPINISEQQFTPKLTTILAPKDPQENHHTITTTTPSKQTPTSAQAKRRAAHQRRMALALANM